MSHSDNMKALVEAGAKIDKERETGLSGDALLANLSEQVHGRRQG